MLDPTAVQGNLLRGYPFGCARFVFVSFASPGAGRAALAALRPAVTTGAPWPAGRRSALALNVALTAPGLAALGLPESVLAGFPEEFRHGMGARSRQLGDAEPDHPAHWEPGWRRWPEVHALVSLYGDDDDALAARRDELLAAPWAQGVAVVVEERGARLPGATEHFGFADGLSQPTVAGFPAPRGASPARPPLAAGEILLGHVDGEGFPAPAPAPAVLGHDGCFLVFRKLAQDVDAYRAFVADRGRTAPGGPVELSARMMGRRPDGAPLAEAPPGDPDGFDFAGDPEGRRCPIGAHVRRANPRDGFGPERGRFFDRHRMVRRGIPYGAPGDAEVGLLFQCLCASIGRQFEFVQSQWLNDGNALGLAGERDPVAGSHPPGGGGCMTVPGDPATGRQLQVVAGLPRLVAMRGGAYLFVPSLAALRWLAQGAWAHPAAAGRPTVAATAVSGAQRAETAR